MLHANTVNRFNRYVLKTDGCWGWGQAIDKLGRARFRIWGKRLCASRVAWTLKHGTDPGVMDVLHKCDNPACVNPDHLFLGTHADNMRDMWRKNRGNPPQGERHGMAKLNQSQVLEIREARKLGELRTSVAKRFGITIAMVTLITKKKLWKHI